VIGSRIAPHQQSPVAAISRVEDDAYPEDQPSASEFPHHVGGANAARQILSRQTLSRSRNRSASSSFTPYPQSSVSIRSMTWADALRPPFPVADAERVLRAAFLAACHAHVLRAVSEQAIVINEAGEALRLLPDTVRSVADYPSRAEAIVQLQQCANALLSVAYRLDEVTREVEHVATMLEARDDAYGHGDFSVSVTARV
jgi:hypothetical protein